MNRNVLFVCTLLLTIGWMLLIFGFSSQTGEESGGLSAIIAEPVTELLIRLQGEITDEARAALYLRVDGVVRTAAHFCEYAILGVLLLLLFRCIGIEPIWLPWLVGAVFALTDEWHQSFSPGRVCDIMDVLIDACGVICGILLCNVLMNVWRKKHVYHS